MIGVMIFNAINVIVWGIISWHFDRWWLMFFALLFIQTYKERLTHTKDEGGDKE